MRARPARSVAAQLMVWQALVGLVVVGVAVLLAYLDARDGARADAAARAEAVSVSVADSPTVREVAATDLSTDARADRLGPFVEAVRAQTGTDFVVVMAPDGTRWTHPDPARVGGTYLGTRAPALAGGVVRETYTGTLGPSVRVVVPVLGPDGRVEALVSAGITVAAVGEHVAQRLPVIALAGLCVLAVALAGSWLVTRRARRLTLGLAGPELARMATWYDAVLHSVREGLVLLDAEGRVQLLNDEARRLLGLPADAGHDVVGRSARDLTLPPDLEAVLLAGDDVADEVVLTAERVLVVSARDALATTGPARGLRGRVVTLRDHTDLRELTGELETTRTLADALRSQAHESANRLHTVVVLVELGRTEEAVELATAELAAAQLLTDQVVGAVTEPVVAALLLGKSAEAAERGVRLVVEAGSELDAGALARAGTPVRDVLTVLGNLLDNAVDAAAADPAADGARVAVLVRGHVGHVGHVGHDGDHGDHGDDGLLLRVADSGTGLRDDDVRRAFERGFSTKPALAGRLHGRGLGLALVDRAVHRLGGTVTVGSGGGAGGCGGAVFTVLLPARRVVPT